MGGIVKAIFGGGQQSAPPPPPVITPAPPPVVEDTQVRAEQQADQLRKRQGRAATILSGGSQDGGTGNPAVGTKALLGQ